ncbi:MAG: hypothetical protein ACFE85_10550 [Candidatus Hodarchaeota archaeon]
MKKPVNAKNKLSKEEISGSETVLELIKGRTPWIFGRSLRKPKIVFPKLKLPKMGIPMPGRSLSIIIIYAILFLLQMGIIYLIYTQPPALGAVPNTGEPMFLFPSLHDSFIIEGIVASIFIFLCSTGFVLLYQASKYVYNKSIAIRILVIGIILVFVTFIALQAMITIKLGGRLFNI